MRNRAKDSGEAHCSLLNSGSRNNGKRPAPRSLNIKLTVLPELSAVKGINLGLGEIVRPTVEAARVYYR